MKRLYYPHLLAQIRYSPHMGDKSTEKFYIHIEIPGEDVRLQWLEAPTIDKLIEKIKAIPRQVVGKDIMDYVYIPNTALEYVLLTAYYKAHGMTDDEISDCFGLEGKADS